MRKIMFAAAAVLALAASAAPSFAAQRSDSETGGGAGGATIENQCESVLGSKDGHAPAYIRSCENDR